MVRKIGPRKNEFTTIEERAVYRTVVSGGTDEAGGSISREEGKVNAPENQSRSKPS